MINLVSLFIMGLMAALIGLIALLVIAGIVNKTRAVRCMPGANKRHPKLLTGNAYNNMKNESIHDGIVYRSTLPSVEAAWLSATIMLHKPSSNVAINVSGPTGVGHGTVLNKITRDERVNVHHNSTHPNHRFTLSFDELVQTFMPQALSLLDTFPNKNIDLITWSYENGAVTCGIKLPDTLSPSKKMLVDGWSALEELVQRIKANACEIDVWFERLTALEQYTPRRGALLALNDLNPHSTCLDTFWSALPSSTELLDVMIAFEIDEKRASSRLTPTSFTTQLGLMTVTTKHSESEAIYDSLVCLLEVHPRPPMLNELLLKVLSIGTPNHVKAALRAAHTHKDLADLPTILNSQAIQEHTNEQANAEVKRWQNLWLTFETFPKQALAAYALRRLSALAFPSEYNTPAWLELLGGVGDVSTLRQLNAWTQEAAWKALRPQLDRTIKSIASRLDGTNNPGQLTLAAQGSAGALSQLQEKGNLTLEE